MDIFAEIHRDLPREGPGNEASTAKALSLLPNLPESPKILDIGCGPGMQTITLAKLTGGHVIGVDVHQPYLDALNQRAEKENLSSQISAVNCSMASLNFEDGRFDLIWAEGAIYIMGFREGLQSWRRLLKPGGALAVTELSWLITDPPEELLNFFGNAYPDMKNVEQNITIIRASGYTIIDSFSLPESAWWDDYYTPLERRIADLRKKYQADVQAHALLNEEQMEIDLYRKYSHCYGYVFYIMQK